MATYEQGILGPFSGKVGTVVGANWRGKNVMRSRPKKSNRVPSEAQQLQRERFTTVAKFLNPIKWVLSQYFGQANTYRSRFNLATSYHLKEAVEWVSGTFEVIYPKVMTSKGELQGLNQPVVTPLANQQLDFKWEDNSGQGMAIAEDQLLVVVFAPDLNMFEVFEHSATREDKMVTLTLSSYFQGLKVHCWGSFVNDERKLSASSSYLGEISIV